MTKQAVKETLSDPTVSAWDKFAIAKLYGDAKDRLEALHCLEAECEREGKFKYRGKIKRQMLVKGVEQLPADKKFNGTWASTHNLSKGKKRPFVCTQRPRRATKKLAA